MGAELGAGVTGSSSLHAITALLLVHSHALVFATVPHLAVQSGVTESGVQKSAAHTISATPPRHSHVLRFARSLPHCCVHSAPTDSVVHATCVVVVAVGVVADASLPAAEVADVVLVEIVIVVVGVVIAVDGAVIGGVDGVSGVGDAGTGAGDGDTGVGCAGVGNGVTEAGVGTGVGAAVLPGVGSGVGD